MNGALSRKHTCREQQHESGTIKKLWNIDVESIGSHFLDYINLMSPLKERGAECFKLHMTDMLLAKLLD